MRLNNILKKCNLRVEPTHPMNMPYISLINAFKLIDEIANEYDHMARGSGSSEERHAGRIGLTATLKIKKALLEDVKKRERSFD